MARVTPYQADETATLRGFLDLYRDTILRQCAGLTADQLNTALPPSTMTLGGLLKHLAYVEDWWFGEIFIGGPPIAPWSRVDWEADSDWDWHSAVADTPDQLHALYAQAVVRSNGILDAVVSWDELSVKPSRRTGELFSLRWIVVHLVEEYARHAGHADLIRESIDGVVGL